MNLVLDGRQPRGRRRSSDGVAPTVSVLRWRSGPAADAVYQLVSAHEAGSFGAFEPDGHPALVRQYEPVPSGETLRQARWSHPDVGDRTILTAPPTTPHRPEAPKEVDAFEPRCSERVPRLGVEGKVVEITVPATSVVVLTVQ